MSADACLMGCSFSLCQFFNLVVIQIKVCQWFVCIVLLYSTHSSNKDHVRLDFPISLFVKVGNKHAVLCFCFLELGIRPSVFTEFKLNQVSLPLVWI
jgi:formate/nitrite transporter FocA (FNT family)